MKRITLFSLLATLSIALTISLAPATTYALGTGQFTLSSSSGSYNINSSLAVEVYENGTSVNVVTANLTYNPSQLQFVSISPAAGSFGGDVSSTGGSGNVSISRYVTPAGTTVSGSTEVATIDFTVLVGSGSSTINFASSSLIEDAGTNLWDGVNNSTSFNLTTPAPVVTPPPTKTPTPSGSTKTTSSSSTVTPVTTATTSSTTPAATTSTPATPTTSTSSSSPKKSSSAKSTSDKLNAKTTANKNSYTGLIYLTILVIGILAVVFGSRKRAVLATKQASASTTYKHPSAAKKSTSKKK